MSNQNALIDPGKMVRGITVRLRHVETALSALDRCFQSAGPGADPRGLALVGDSGAGKSQLLTRVAARHPQRREAKGLLTPVILIRASPRPTAKGMAEQLLHALGDPHFSSGSENAKTLRLITLLMAAETRLIMIDEFNHLVDQSSQRVQHHVADYLKVLGDETKVSIVVSGLSYCLDVIHANPQLKRRFLAPIELPCFDWLIPAHREELLNLLHTFQFKLAPFSFPDLATDTIAFRIYIATSGLIGRIANLLIEAMLSAQTNGRFGVLMTDFYAAAKTASFDLPLAGVNPFGKLFDATTATAAMEARVKGGEF